MSKRRKLRPALLLETCEDRILCDAAPQVTPIEQPQAKPDATVKLAPPAPTSAGIDFPAPVAGAQPASLENATTTATSPAAASSTTTNSTQLSEQQRAALTDVIKESANQIWFQENVGQFAPGVRYGFKTQFGSMLVYDDHLSIIASQVDPATGAVGLHTVNVNFDGSSPWQIVPGGESGVLGSYQQPDGTSLTPHIYKELTLRNVYDGIDLRLYSQDQGVLEFDWLVAKAQDYSKIKINFTGQDGLNFGADGSATLDLRFQDLALKMPEVYQVVNGDKHLVAAAMVAGETPGQMRYSISGIVDPNAPLVIDPNVVWSTYIDLNDTSTTANTAGVSFDSYLSSIAVNSNGTYAGGWINETVTNGSWGNYMEVNAGFSQGTADRQNYIYRLSNDGLHVTAWTSTLVLNDNSGVTNQKLNSGTNDAIADMKLFPDGRVLVGFNSGVLQIYSADLVTRSYNAEPVSMDTLNGVVIVDDNSFYASGRVTAAVPIAQIPAANIGPDATFAGNGAGLNSEGIIVRYTRNAATTIAASPTGATQSGTTVTITTTTPHGLGPVGSQRPVVISGVGVAGYNGSFLATVTSATTFTYTTASGLAASGGGSVNAIVPNWATYVGGNGDEYFTSIALTPDKTKLVFATSAAVGAAYPALVNAVDNTIVGATELLVGVLPEQSTTPAAFSVFSYLGGDTAEGTLASNTTAAIVTATDTHFYVAGNTNSAAASMPGIAGGAQVTNGGGNFDVFVSRIPLNGSAGSGFQTTFIGGTTEDNVGGMGFDTRANRLLVFGTTSGGFPTKDTTPGSNYYQNTAGGGTDIFVATFTPDLTVNDYATYIGGGNNDYLGQTGDLIGQGHVVYSSVTGLTYLATTVHSTLPTGIIGTPPGKDTGKSNGGNDTHVVFTFNINIFDFGDAPVSYENSTPGKEALSSTIRIGTAVDSEATAQNSTNADGDDVLTSDDEDGLSTIPLIFTTDTTYSLSVSVLNNSGASRTLQGWIDFNRDGLFQAGERASVSVPSNASQQTATLTWSSLPGITSGQSYIRLRLSDNALTDNGGTATIDERSVGTGNYGEIEDYALTINTLSSLTGTVYRDPNNDGLQSGVGETGIQNVTVTLTGTNDLGASVNLTTTTNASGVFTFSNLRPSNAAGYTITESQPAAFLDGKDKAGTLGGTISTPPGDTITGVVVPVSTTASGYLFGELPPSSLAGTVYRDLNNDGVQLGAGETGINGVTITLTGTNDLGAVNLTTTTDASGNYSFGNLRPGTYTITETQPAGLLDGKETAGTGTTTAGTVNNAAVSNTISNIVVGTNETGTGNLFGELPPSSLSGSVYRDFNNDGLFNGSDTTINGVTITLTGTDDLGAAVNLSTTTAGAGAYSFTNLRPGTYTITETQPAGLLDGKETVGTQASGTINNAVDSNTISNIALASNTTGSGNLFGELPPSSLAGTAYRDINNDGLINGADTTINGVTITLTGTDDRGVAVNTSTTTAGAGAYSFTNLRPGTYTITETQPAGLLDGKETAGTGTTTAGTVNNAIDNNTISNIGVSANETGVGNNFGELPPSALSGSVYNDLNNDGALNGAETTINGVTISLTGTDDRGTAVNLSTATAGAGAYSFTNLRPGTYTITEVQPAGVLDGKETVGTQASGTVNNAVDNNTIANIALASNTTGSGNLFGELPPASLAATVYQDLNNDGVQSGAGETGISGVTVTLTGTDDRGNAVSTPLVTDASGNVSFGNLRPGTYRIAETQPAGFLDGTDSNGTPAGTLANDSISAIPVVAATAGTGYKFGELPPSSLAGTVYRDLNNDGVQLGAGETGISGVTITLTGTNDLGAVNLTTTTDASGNYSFGNLRPGTYTITETQPAGLLDGKETAGTGTTTAGTVNNAAVSNTISNIVVGTNQTGTGNLFGELPPSSLAGTVYRDLNNDGVQLGAGETGINGVTITLTGTNDLGAVNLTTTTDASGNYSFGNLRPGTYTITETQPAGLLDGKETAGTGTTTAGTVNNAAVSNTISNIVVGTNETGTGNLFGELPPSSLAGTVFNDGNNDGVLNGTDAGISGVTVALSGTDDLGNSVSQSTTTSGTGAYSFTNLRPGTYTITETQPVGLLDGKETAGTGTTTAGTVNNAIDNNTITNIVVSSNQTGVGNNFAELSPSSLAGVVYNDLNNNGVQLGAGETGISGVSIALSGTDDRGTAVNLTTTTNGSGAYSFGSLRPGTYTITETQPVGLLDGKETVGSQASGTINNLVDSNTISNISIGTNVSGTGNNFGELPPGSFSATVYRDVNNDGVQLGAGETGISGVTVTLTGTDDRGNAVNIPLNTDASGNVTFSSVRPGTYTLTETQPGAFNDGIDSNGTPAGTLGNDTVSNITLTAGTAASGYKFGELPTTSLSGTVYRDLNNDGAQLGAGETGISGVIVTLTGVDDLGSNVNLSTTTDANGNYAFANLRPSNASGYTITETQPAGLLDGKETPGSGTVTGGTVSNAAISNTISGIVVASGQSGTGFLFGELPPSTLAGTVYRDLNNDGAQLGAGETGVSGATITLTGTDDLGVVNLTTTTDGSGNYSFGNLRPGTYTITETQPAGLLDGKETVGTQASGTINNAIDNNTIANITLPTNTTGSGNLFGELPPASLTGFVYSDTSNAGVKDAFEFGIPGAAVTLTGTDDRGNAVSIPVTTAAGTGAYSFTNLRPGTYTITETQPSGYNDGADTIGTPGGTTANDVFSAIALTAGTAGANNNFGESPIFNLTKSLQATSVAATAGNSVTLGEVATFRLVATIPAGSFTNFQLQDALPAGYQFINGSAVVSLVSSAGQLTSSTLAGAGLAQTSIGTPTFAMPDAAVSDNSTTNSDSYVSGTDVFFKLGNLTNTDTSAATTEAVVIEFQARVVNELANQAGTTLDNTFSVLFDKDGGVGGLDPHGGNSNTVTSTVAEPNVTVTKVANPTSGVDAGDVITYTVTLTNPGGANSSTAFDTLLVDTMPANLLVTGITSTTLNGGATVDTAAAIGGGGTSITGQYDIPAGGSVQIVYTATVQSGFPPNGSLTNAAVLTWTSLNGGNSTAPDANERFGAAGSTFNDGSLNDYRRTTSATTTGAGPTFNKLLFSTSDAGTVGSNVGIGETVTYALVVTLPEGTASGFNVLDTLPAGLSFVSSSIVTSAAASNGLLAANFNGTVPAPTVTQPGGNVNFAFGAITTAGDNVANNNTFLVLVNTVVTDVAGNSGLAPQTTLSNSATFSGTGIPPTTPPPVTTTVVEPRLVVAKGVDDTTADLGQTLTYTVTINHTASSTQTAYDLILRDTIPAGLSLNVGSINVVGATIATNTSTSSLLALTFDQLDVGSTITVTYTATVGTGAALVGTSQDNNARLFWDSLADDTGSNAVFTGVADGTNDRDFGATPGYTEADTPTPDDPAQDTVRVTVNANSISGFVYLDSDNSGTRNGAETGLGSAVNVTLSGTTFFGAAYTQTVAADATTGAYTFTNVPRGTYTITETQPAAFVDGIETVGTLFGGVKSDALGSDTITNVVVPVGSQNATGYNFGELQPSSLAGFTYLDLNNDGTKQAGETGLGTAIQVTLTGTDAFGQPVSLTTTSAAGTGAYSFAGLRPSDGSGYTITENDAAVVPTTFFDGKDTAGSLSGTVTGASPKFDAINVSLAQNQSGTDYNFAEIQKSSLSGSVYADLNGNGAFDAFERGVPGVTITLTGTDDQGTAVNLTVTTNASGLYTFANIRPSNAAGYTITETQPADYLDGIDTIGTPGGTTNNDFFSAVVLGAGVNGANNNFGEAPNFALTKTLVSTSEAGTAGNNVTIGEVATFRLVVTIPAGQLTDFQVQDFLPAGYAYVNGSARASLVSSAGQLTSSTLAGAGLAQTSIATTPTFVLPDAAVSSNSTTNDDTYASGTDVFFKFGDLTNTDTAATTEAIVIEFNAVVVNEAANVSGRTLSNSFGVLYERNPGVPGPEPDPNPPGTPPNVDTQVITPALVFAKTASPIGALSAGDVVTYTLTFTNIGTATAFDALVRDVMPPDIKITSISSTVLTGGATVDNAAVITGPGTGLTGQYDVPVGGSVKITYLGTVQGSATPGAAETNNAELTWTSLNGSNSLAPDAGERYGAPGSEFNDGTVNNFRRIDSQTVTIGTSNFDKQLFSTSEPSTAGNNVAIGETVTYALIVTSPAGTTPSLSVVDTLPAGLQYVSSSIVTTAAASNGFLTQDFNGTVPAPTVTGGAGDGDDVFFNFGAITIAADGNSQNNTFLILVNAKVTNVAGNVGLNPPGQTLLDNTATFDIPGDGVPPTTPTPPVRVRVVEANLGISKTFDVTSADAGDTAVVTIVVTNTGTGPAHDVSLTDVVNTAKFSNITPLTTPAGFTFNNTAGTVTYTGGTIAAAGSATFTFSVKLTDGVNPSEVLSNTATVTATSLPGVVTGERTFGPVSDTATLPVPAFFDLTKNVQSPAGGKVRIGDTVTYSVTVEIIEGTTQNISLTDILPAGMGYVAGSAVVSNANGMTVNGFTANAVGQTLTMTATSVVNPGNTDSTATDTDIFTITYQAKVLDVAGNQSGTLLTNNLTGGGTGVPPSDPPPPTVQVVTPTLTIAKAFNVPNADAGDTVQVTIVVGNTGTGDAFDVAVNDAINVAKFGTITAVSTPAGFTFNNVAGNVSYAGGTIAAGSNATFTFTVKLTDGVNPSELLSNTATATATSMPGAVPGERTFGPVSDTATLDVPAVFNLVKGITSPLGGKVQIGDVVTYQVAVTLVEGTTKNISLTDVLPTGMSYVAGSATVSNANGMTVNGFAAGIAGQTLTLTATSVVNPGNVDNTATTDSDTFFITYQAVVNDVAGNTRGTLLTNSLTGGGTGVPPSNPPPVTTTVSEPSLKITKAADDATPDLGQTVHYTLTIQHTAASDATAFDILVKDTLPAGLSGLANITVIGAAIDTNNSTATALDLKLDQLAVGGTITIEFDATVSTLATFTGQSIDNNARIYWDSQATESPNAVLTGAPDGDSDRDYGATGADEVFNLDPQDAQDTERVTVNANTISGVVYLDTDSSGTRNGAEAGVGTGVQVTLSGTTFFGEAFTQTVIADPTTGIYAFTNVPRSNAAGYTITETQPAAFVDGIETIGTLFGGVKNDALGSDTITNVVVPVGSQNATGYNFGELRPSSLAGFTYLDLNNDGTKQAGETGLGTAIPITLTGTDVFGQPVSLSTNSVAGTGAYSFAGLRPSNGSGYTIAENDSAIVPTTFFDGKDTPGSLAGTVVGTSPKFDAINVSLAQNQNGTNYNFAEINKSSLSGSVYADLNGNGAFDAFERGVPGVTITLTGTDDQGTAVNLTVTTNASGLYTFANIRPSNAAGYTISETQPADYLDGVDTIGTPGGTTNNDFFSAVVLGAGVNGANNNFGEAPNFALTKTLVSTSEAGTAGNNVAIGEVATFRLVVTIPAGQLADFQVQDFLPAGYAYVNGSARAGLVGAVTSSTINAPLAGIGATPTVVLPDSAVSDNSLTNSDTYASGTDVFFKFGTLTNPDTTAAVEAIVIEFNAKVVNEAANQSGTTLSNSFGVLYERNPGVPGPEPDPNPPGTPPNVTTTVVAPVLTFSKSVTAPATVSAGDTIAYSLTFTNTGTATAFDALVRDVMPADVRITSITGTTLLGGATGDSAVVITGPGTGLSGQFDVPVGGSVTINYTGTVQLSAPPGVAETNNAELTWTSINGSNSLTPDAGERFGAAGSTFGDGSLNDYRRTDSKTVTVGTATFDKQLFSTSDSATAGNNVAIGETVTYALIVTGPAGTAPSLSVIDTLPAGLQFVSASIVTSAAASNGFLAQDFNGTVPAPTITGGASDGDDVTFNFGAITVAADGNTANNTFLILVNAKVTNAASNSGLTPPGQTLLDNTATFDIPGDGVPPSTPPPVRVNVVEAQLTILKSFNVISADAGDTVQITVVVGNTGNGPAHDVTLTDPVNLAKFGTITPVTTPAGFAFNNAAGTVSYTGGTIAAGASATFVFSVKLTDGVDATEVLSNTATATATSQPGVVPGERSFGPVSSTAQLNVPGVFDLAKDVQSPVGGTVRIGEVVTYRVTVRVVEGTTQGLTLKDTLPNGMAYVPGSAVVSNANGMTVNGFTANAAGQVLTITTGDIVNPGNVDDANATDSDTFTITYQAVVQDVAGNVSGTLLTNNLTGTPTPPIPPKTPPPPTVQVIEPTLTILKSFNVAQADAGDTVQVTIVVGNTGTGDAYDVSVGDLVDTVKFGSIIGVTTPSGFTFNNVGGNVSYSGGTIVAGGNATFTFTVKLTDGVNPSEILSNTATATATSMPGVVSGERTFGPISSTATLNVPAVFNLSKGITSPLGGKVLIGDVVTYQVAVTLVEGTTKNIQLNDILPAGLTYVPNSAAVSNANGMTVNGFAANNVGQVLTITATSVVNPGNADNPNATDSDTFFITYQAVVQDISGNTSGTLLTNNISGGGTGVPPTQPPPVTTTVTEPSLRVTKAVNDSAADLGQTLHFTLTIQNLSVPNGADAYDILVKDALPSGLGALTNVVVTGATVDANNSTATTLDVKLSSLPLGATATVEFDATVTTAASFAGLTIDNNARIFWDSQPGESPNAVLTGVPDGDNDRDYGATPGAEVFDQDTDPAQDTERLTVNSSSITGAVYHDSNANNLFDEGAANGIAGQTVTLTGTTIFGEAVNITVSTGAGGVFTFTNLAPSNAAGYTITEAQPPGYLDGGETAGTFGGNVSNVVGSDTITGIQVAAGNNSGTGYNFGEVLASSLGGGVFSDGNNDGTQQGGENGIAGVTVTLTGTDYLGVPVNVSLTSDASGAYNFTGLRPGTYTLTETQPAGFLDGLNNIGSEGGVTFAPPNDQISNIQLAEAKTGANYNFAELTPGSFSGSVFQDVDNDGAFTNVDLPIAGAKLTLTGTDDLGNAVTATATTLADGSFTFGNLRPGTYQLAETQPSNYLDGPDTPGTTGGVQTNDTFSNITLNVGQSGSGYLFAEKTPPDLVTTKDDGVLRVKPGQLVTYTITVKNVSVQNAASVTVTDPLPLGKLEFVSATGNAQFDPNTGVVTWDVGPLAGNGAQTVTFTLTARVTAKGAITNTVTAVDISGVDLNPPNNTASDTDQALAEPDLYVLKTDNLLSAKVGTRTTYVITGGNAGDQDAVGVTVSDVLPPGVKFISASNGGQLVNGRVVWNLGTLKSGDTFRLTINVVVQEKAAGSVLLNTVTIEDRFGSKTDPTPGNNFASDVTLVPKVPRTPAKPFEFAFDVFNNFSTREPGFGHIEPLSGPPVRSPIDIWREPLITPAPVYSGEADPGSELFVEIYNANGDKVGDQSVVVDAGGNWLVSFPSSDMRDYPASVRITEVRAPYASDGAAGRNLRNFFVPAIHAGHFTLGGQDATPIDPRAFAPLIDDLKLDDPFALDEPVKYGAEMLPNTGTANGR